MQPGVFNQPPKGLQAGDTFTASDGSLVHVWEVSEQDRQQLAELVGGEEVAAIKLQLMDGPQPTCTKCGRTISMLDITTTAASSGAHTKPQLAAMLKAGRGGGGVKLPTNCCNCGTRVPPIFGWPSGFGWVYVPGVGDERRE